MDGTSVVRHQQGWGTVLKGPACKPRREQATLADRRGSVSFLASICHDSAVQGKLPQILLANEHQVSLGVLHRLQASGTLPVNIYIWREKSSWTTHAIMRRYLTLLARCLGETVAERTVVVLVDVNRAHRPFHTIACEAAVTSYVLCAGQDDEVAATSRHCFVQALRLHFVAHGDCEKLGCQWAL